MNIEHIVTYVKENVAKNEGKGHEKNDVGKGKPGARHLICRRKSSLWIGSPAASDRITSESWHVVLLYSMTRTVARDRWQSTSL